MSERLLIGAIRALASDLLIVYLWHRVIAHHVPSVKAQVIATLVGIATGLLMLAARWWTNLWRSQVPAAPAIAVRLIVWAMFLVGAGFATASDPRIGAVVWALMVSTGAPALSPVARYLYGKWHWRPRHAVAMPRPAAIVQVRRPVPAPRLAFDTSGDGT